MEGVGVMAIKVAMKESVEVLLLFPHLDWQQTGKASYCELWKGKMKERRESPQDTVAKERHKKGRGQENKKGWPSFLVLCSFSKAHKNQTDD
jgi:hypothetical protein